MLSPLEACGLGICLVLPLSNLPPRSWLLQGPRPDLKPCVEGRAASPWGWARGLQPRPHLASRRVGLFGRRDVWGNFCRACCFGEQVFYILKSEFPALS